MPTRIAHLSTVAIVLWTACGSGSGPWPTDPVRDYTAAYGLGPVQSASLDDAHNLWLLSGESVGVLRPGRDLPVWAKNLGQASRFLSSVICGGSAGQAYVGYLAYELKDPSHSTPSDREEGDADVLRLDADGHPVLERHLRLSNSNDPRYDETRSVLACAKAMRGPFRGEVYLGTNHGVTRVRGLEFADHRHPLFRYPEPDGSLKVGYTYAVTVAQNGDIFLANEWKLALMTPPSALLDFLDPFKAPWKLDTYAEALGSQIEMDYWRATAKTSDGRYFLASKRYGLWELTVEPRGYRQVQGLPKGELTSLAAPDDGSLYVGTAEDGLWRMDSRGSLQEVSHVAGRAVRQLFLDPTVTPAMLLVLTDQALTVLRLP